MHQLILGQEHGHLLATVYQHLYLPEVSQIQNHLNLTGEDARTRVVAEKPPTMRSVVNSPQPDGPRMHSNSPLPAVNETPLTAGTVP
jgi:hypothetical protein